MCRSKPGTTPCDVCHMVSLLRCLSMNLLTCPTVRTVRDSATRCVIAAGRYVLRGIGLLSVVGVILVALYYISAPLYKFGYWFTDNNIFLRGCFRRGCFRSYSGRCQSPEHEMSHGYVHPRLGGFGQGFVVLTQPSAPAQPRSFPPPSAGAAPQRYGCPWAVAQSPEPNRRGTAPSLPTSPGSRRQPRSDSGGETVPASLLMTGLAPSRSWILAGCATTASAKPTVSAAICRLRPRAFLPAP